MLPADVIALLASQVGAVAGHQLRARGSTRADLGRWLRAGLLVRVASDTFVDGTSWRLTRDDVLARHHLVLAATVVRAPNCVVSHRSAAVLHGLPILGHVGRPEITRPLTGRALTGTRSHRLRVMPESERQSGLPVTSAVRTCIDVSRTHGLEAGLVVSDAALAIGRATAAQLSHEALGLAATPGVSTARTVAEFADGRAESPLESLSRWRLHEAGVEPPVPQVRIWIDTAEWRVDFLWPELAVVGEADGRGKYRQASDALWREKLRQRELERAGLAVVRWFWGDTADTPSFAPVVAQLRQSFERQSLRSRPLLADHVRYSAQDLDRARG